MQNRQSTLPIMNILGSLGLAGNLVGGLWGFARRQSLELSYEPSDTDLIELDGTSGHLHLRFRVRNRGWRAAEDATVLLTGVTRLGDDGVLCDPVPLRELKWANVDAAQVVIQPRQHRLVDVAAVTR